MTTFMQTLMFLAETIQKERDDLTLLVKPDGLYLLGDSHQVYAQFKQNQDGTLRIEQLNAQPFTIPTLSNLLSTMGKLETLQVTPKEDVSKNQTTQDD